MQLLLVKNITLLAPEYSQRAGNIWPILIGFFFSFHLLVTHIAPPLLEVLVRHVLLHTLRAADYKRPHKAYEVAA